MSDTNRNELKDQLQAMAAGRGDGIDLDTPSHWVIEGLKDPVRFFEHLPDLLPSGSIFYVEGESIASDVAAFYTSNCAENAVDVVRDMIFPAPDIYHFKFSPDVCAGLCRFAGSRSVSEMFDHIKAYRGETLLFTFHDAFGGCLRISEHLPDETVARFCNALGVSRRREETRKRDPEQLRKLLRTLEYPDQIKFADEKKPWWKRLLRL